MTISKWKSWLRIVESYPQYVFGIPSTIFQIAGPPPFSEAGRAGKCSRRGPAGVPKRTLEMMKTLIKPGVS